LVREGEAGGGGETLGAIELLVCAFELVDEVLGHSEMEQGIRAIAVVLS
jgi:hypothetical protein